MFINCNSLPAELPGKPILKSVLTPGIDYSFQKITFLWENEFDIK